MDEIQVVVYVAKATSVQSSYVHTGCSQKLGTTKLSSGGDKYA